MCCVVTNASPGEFSVSAAVIGCTHPVTSLELPFSGLGRFGDFSINLVEFSVFIANFWSPREMHLFSNLTIQSCTLDVGYTAVGLEGHSWQVVEHDFPVGLAVVGGLVDVIVEDAVVGVDVVAVGFVGCRLVRLGVGWVLFLWLGFRVLASVVAGFLVGVCFFFANLCRCNVLGVSGGLVHISVFLLGC